jgi:hypothetical protein
MMDISMNIKGIEKYVTMKSALFFHLGIYDVIFTNQFLLCLKRGRTDTSAPPSTTLNHLQENGIGYRVSALSL